MRFVGDALGIKLLSDNAGHMFRIVKFVSFGKLFNKHKPLVTLLFVQTFSYAETLKMVHTDLQPVYGRSIALAFWIE